MDKLADLVKLNPCESDVSIAVVVGHSESFFSYCTQIIAIGLFSVPAPPSYCQVSGGVFSFLDPSLPIAGK
jgi:hypothetical protein